MGAFSGCGADQLKVLFIQKFQPVVTAMATAFARYGFIPKKRTCIVRSARLSASPAAQKTLNLAKRRTRANPEPRRSAISPNGPSSFQRQLFAVAISVATTFGRVSGTARP